MKIALAACAALCLAGVVRSADVCESDDIHPKTKDKLSERIAQSVMKYFDQ